MEVNSVFIKKTRLSKGWTQQQLSDIADISLRTIQRIEKNGTASNESVSSLAVSFEVDRAELLFVPRVASSALRKVTFKKLYISMAVATVLGFTAGALAVYLFV
jgi:transcriptional regulator with XRE-family HTH domain